MKKLFAVLLFLPVVALSQKKRYTFPFEKKDQFISFQHGFPNTIKNSLESFFGFDQTNKKSIGPVSIAYEYHIKPEFSIGINLSYASYSADYKDVFGFSAAFTGKIRNTALMIHSIKYFQNESKYLIYAKGNVGLNLWSGEYRSANGDEYKNFNAPTPVAYNAMVGVKYGLTSSIYPYIEAGYGKYVVAAGISFKLK